MSPNFLNSMWGNWEFTVAQSQAATEKRSRIIVILYGDISDAKNLDPNIRDYLKLNTYVEWGDKYFWRKLKYAMPHTTMINSDEDNAIEMMKL
jgi:protein toll